jgi:glycosyltransferase involved in cell wall biosynthesis
LKKIFWNIYQKSAISDAACFHATSENEYEDIRRLGFKQPISIIPCGVNVDSVVQTKIDKRKRLFFLGRIHPVKGVDILLKAWSCVQNRFPDWDLYLAGPDNDGYLAEMQLLSKKLNLQRIYFCGPMYGEEKLEGYRNASIYVLPTHSENFGITVAEALAAGVPAIVSKGAPWHEIVAKDAGWWVDVGVEPLVACLLQALSTSEQRLQEMGKAGHDWMLRDFSWKSVSEKFLDTYRWVICGGVPPHHVILK